MASTPTVPESAESVSSAEYAQRFGALLRRHRRRGPMELRRLAARSANTFSSGDLRAYERGQRPLEPRLLERLCDLYEIPLESILPDHRSIVIDLERRELRLAGKVYPLPDSEQPSPHLARYVRIVNRLRSQPMKSPATLRRDDAEALAEALELDVDEVAELLSEVIGQEAAARRRAFMLRSGTGTLAAFVVAGTGVIALDSRTSQAETVVLAAAEVPLEDGASDDGASDAEASDGASARSGVDPVVVPPSEAVAGPDLRPEPSPPRPARDEAGGSAGEEQAKADPVAGDEFEDETNIDAPGGPVTIERDEHDDEGGAVDAADGVAEDETNVDAPGGPVTIERDEYDDERDGDGQGDSEGEGDGDSQGDDEGER